MGRGRGACFDLAVRQPVITWIDEAGTAGARRARACRTLGLTLRTVQRWREAGEVRRDGRAAALRPLPAKALSPEERAPVLATVNRPEFADRSRCSASPIGARASTATR